MLSSDRFNFHSAVGSKIIIKSEDARGDDGSLRRNEEKVK